MKTFLFLILLIASANSNAQPKTKPLAGTYSYGTSAEKGRVGYATVYPETDSTLLVYIDLNRGAPSYNMGQVYGRVKLKKGVGTLEQQEDRRPCRLRLSFASGRLLVNTINDSGCMFGANVFADGIYKRYAQKVPAYFLSPTGKKVYFQKVPPEKWDKE